MVDGTMTAASAASAASTGRRDGDIVLDDLTNPQFPDRHAGDPGRDRGRRKCRRSSRTRYVTAAVAQTGLDDFGEPDFREPLDVLCRVIAHRGWAVARRRS